MTQETRIAVPFGPFPKATVSDSESSFRVDPGHTQQLSIQAPDLGSDKRAVLQLMARIEDTGYGGSDWAMRIRLNQKAVGERFSCPIRLLNKPQVAASADGESKTWYDPARDAWLVPFAPDVREDTGKGLDATFQLDVTDLLRVPGRNVIEIEHTKRFMAVVLDTPGRLIVERLCLSVVPANVVGTARAAVTPNTVRAIEPAVNTVPDDEVPTEEAFYSLWHGKQREQSPQLVFDDLTGWDVVRINGIEARATLSREKKLFSDITTKLTYRATGPHQYVELRPREPILLPEPFDALDLWLHEDSGYWRHQKDGELVSLHMTDAKGHGFTFDFGRTFAAYWFLRHGVLRKHAGNWQSDEGHRFPSWPCRFNGLRIGPCGNTEPRAVYLDSLACYMEQRTTRANPCPAPVVDIEDTLPTPEQDYETEAWEKDGVFVLTSRAKADDTLVLTYKPRTGTFSDVSACFAGGKTFLPMKGGGLVFEQDGLALPPGHTEVKARLQKARLQGRTVRCTWSFDVGHRTTAVDFTLALHGRTLVVDVTAADAGAGNPAGLRWGAVSGLERPDTVFVPFLSLSHQSARSVEPVVAEGLFILGMLDWYVSQASVHTSSPGRQEDGTAAFSTGCDYSRLTDGCRRPLRERLHLSISPRFEEILPNTPHPVSPNRERLARYMYSVDTDRRLALRPQMHKLLHDLGLGPFIDMMHAPLWWRRGGEGFDMRTRPRPDITDERLQAYTALLHQLGNLAGMLTEYNDYDPANIHFRSGDVALNPDGTWRQAWTGCYAAKLGAGREIARHVAPELKRKYDTDIVYFDTHTNIGLRAVDFEALTPSSGTARERFLNNCELIKEERAVHGALTSEGMQRWLYAGLTDMDFAYFLNSNTDKLPLLPTFDLLKIHPRQHGVAAMRLTNRTIGKELCWPQPEGCHRFEQVLANAIAYGHMGNICGWLKWRLDGLIKYWAMLYDLQQEVLTDNAVEISWFDGHTWQDTSATIKSGAYLQGRLRVRYAHGLCIWVHYHDVQNGGRVSLQGTWKVKALGQEFELPRYGWLAVKESKGSRPEILEYHALVNGQRVDYAEGPEVLYADSRGQHCEFPGMSLNGAVLVRRTGAGTFKVAPCGDLGPIDWKHPADVPWDDEDILETSPAPNRGCGPVRLNLQRLAGCTPSSAELKPVQDGAPRQVPHTLRNGILEFQPDTETESMLLSFDPAVDQTRGS